MWAAKGNEAQYAAAGAANADFLDSWGSSMTRKAAFGAAWDTTGPGITADTAPTSALAVGKGATKVAAPPYTEKIYALEASTDLVDVRITGHARLGDGSVDETSLGSHTFCLRSDQCEVPRRNISGERDRSRTQRRDTRAHRRAGRSERHCAGPRP